MNIEEVKRRADLLMLANNSKYCLVSELANEMEVKKTDLMQLIVDNPKLFQTNKERISKENIGLSIEEVYASPEDNYRTDEWLQKQITENAKYIHIYEIYNAAKNDGKIYGYYILIDNYSNSKYREHLWRNTEEKVSSIRSLGVTYSSRFLDVNNDITFDCVIYKNGLKKLEEAGWIHNDLKPIKS